MNQISLVQMRPNQKGRVVEILGGYNLQKRLSSMGLLKGKEIKKISHIGLKGPVVVKVGKTILALGYGMAAKVLVETE